MLYPYDEHPDQVAQLQPGGQMHLLGQITLTATRSPMRHAQGGQGLPTRQHDGLE